MTAKKKRNTLDDVDLKPLAVYTLFDSVLPTDTGVYAIVNKLDKRFYIGSARSARPSPSQKGFRSRFGNSNGHRQQLAGNRHHCKFLQRAYNKVIEDGFDPNSVFEIWVVEYVERDRCIEIEDWYLKFYRPTYNGVLTARGVHDGEYSPSTETRKKWSIAATGRGHTPETCAKLSALHKGKKKSAEHVENLSLAKSENYVGISPSGEVFYFKGAQRFADSQGLIKACILKCVRGLQKNHKKWLFFRQDDPILTDYHLQELVISQKLKYRLYVAISPAGEIFEFDDVSAFAKSHSLRSERIVECADRLRFTHKEWHIYYLDDLDVTPEYLEHLASGKAFRSSFPSKYIAISPYGEVVYFDNEYDFAREHNLVQSGINKCMVGKADHHKNWKFYYSHDERLTPEFIDSVIREQQITIRREYVGVSPVGEIVFFDNAAEFARDNNLLNVCISKCVLGQADTHDGWHFYFAQNVTDDFLQDLSSSKLIPKYIAISPQGEKVYFNSMADFAEGTEFNRNGISQCVNGRLKTHRGWLFMEYQDDLAA